MNKKYGFEYWDFWCFQDINTNSLSIAFISFFLRHRAIMVIYFLFRFCSIVRCVLNKWMAIILKYCVLYFNLYTLICHHMHSLDPLWHKYPHIWVWIIADIPLEYTIYFFIYNIILPLQYLHLQIIISTVLFWFLHSFPYKLF